MAFGLLVWLVLLGLKPMTSFLLGKYSTTDLHTSTILPKTKFVAEVFFYYWNILFFSYLIQGLIKPSYPSLLLCSQGWPETLALSASIFELKFFLKSNCFLTFHSALEYQIISEYDLEICINSVRKLLIGVMVENVSF